MTETQDLNREEESVAAWIAEVLVARGIDRVVPQQVGLVALVQGTAGLDLGLLVGGRQAAEQPPGAGAKCDEPQSVRNVPQEEADQSSQERTASRSEQEDTAGCRQGQP